MPKYVVELEEALVEGRELREAAQRERLERMRRAWQANPDVPVKELAERFGFAAKTVKRHLGLSGRQRRV